jgi:hypothetical protein
VKNHRSDVVNSLFSISWCVYKPIG